MPLDTLLNERVKEKNYIIIKKKMKYRKEESYEKEYISYTKYFNNNNIIWMSKERISKYIRTRSGSAIYIG